VVARVVERWRYRGKWWLLPYGQRRLYYRLEARPVYQQGQIESARLLEVFEENGAWTISYLCD
jgi:hypothetical protein